MRLSRLLRQPHALEREKIQVVFDLISNTFIDFERTLYTAKDQSRAEDISSIAEEGDLVIRDLGYFALERFTKMNLNNIKYVSRLRNNVKIYDRVTKKEINLLEILRKKGTFDDWVILGSNENVLVRLVVQKLSEEQASLRRHKARTNRDKRLNHSKGYYELLGYCCYIRTVDKDGFSAPEVQKVYSLRWRIENIFKCWKVSFTYKN